ncbi:hypothetical protein Pint_32035 [Pistacia integerrima]|uniref:Uncharacterized protein n=1 Tax=Pistacia integerrima TaxID=434235 RepID=A0ACC0XQ71_9ROSI|nr:hypothetical protein Pint_32035 [Pistacia integerrima]
MANNSVTTQPPPAHPPRKGLFRYIAIFLLSIIVIVGVAVLIIWWIVKPKQLVYTIEDASIHNYNLTGNSRLNSTFDFTIRAYNPNGRASIDYDSIEVSAEYENQNIAFTTLEPFHQPTRNVTHLEANLVAQNIALPKSISNDLRRDKSKGEIDLDVRLKAKIRFKVGLWKSDHRTMRIICSPVTIHFSSSKNFERTECEIDI